MTGEATQCLLSWNEARLFILQHAPLDEETEDLPDMNLNSMITITWYAIVKFLTISLVTIGQFMLGLENETEEWISIRKINMYLQITLIKQRWKIHRGDYLVFDSIFE